MIEIILSTLVCGLLLLLFFICILFGILRRRKNLLITGSITFVLFLTATSFTLYLIAAHSNEKMAASKPSNNFEKPDKKVSVEEEIYISMFNVPVDKCIDVLNFKDQGNARYERTRWMHFNTCPSELTRLLSNQDQLLAGIILLDSTFKDLYSRGVPDWWQPEKISRDALAYSFNYDNDDRRQFLIVSKDSSEAYYCEILY